jgi:hypothetical protein
MSRRHHGWSKHPGPPKPVNPSLGLSSGLNSQTVEVILRASIQEEIESILNKIGYRPKGGATKHGNHIAPAGPALTPEDKASVQRRRLELIEREAIAFINSEAGRSAVERAQAELVARQALASDDLMNRLCREAAERTVREWIDSLRGKEAVKQLAAKSVDAKITAMTPSQRMSWINTQLGALDGFHPGKA